MPHAILFVDDEPEVLSLLARTFPARDGYEALTATSGEAALAVLAAREVDLLVTDQRMPGMTGLELIAAARRRLPNLCAIVLTAYTEPGDLVAAINQGQVYRYLLKPWESVDLRQTVASALEQVELKRDRARLAAELERRLAALQIASEIAREVGAAERPAALLERVVARVPEIVPCDAAAALLAPPGATPVLLVRARARLGDAALRAVRADALAAHAEHAGTSVDAAALELRLVGDADGRGPDAFSSRLTVPVHTDGAAAGVVVLESARIEAFGDGDARVLDVLVNELAEALRAFATRVDAERRRIERVVESLADGLVFAPEEGEEVVANPAARRMLGAPATGPLTRAWLEDALGRSALALGTSAQAGAAGRGAGGQEILRGERSLAPLVSPVEDGRGRAAGVAVVLRDVTEQRRLEERKEEFVHVVSHELRTPLTSITGALDLVLEGLVGALDPKQERYLRMARDSTERLNALVDDILDVARLAKGKLQIELEPVRLDELARAAAERWQAAAAERGIELQVDVPAAPVSIAADPGRLGQVLANLLTNAVKFSPENGVIRVRVFRSQALGGLAGLSVWNAGDAIPEEDLERIFEKFEQSRTGSRRRTRGSGLGLAICRGLVEAHGGRIWAESGPGQGVRLVAVLPDEPGTQEKVTRRDGAVAVVLDEPDTAALARAVLEGRGFRCRTASTPDEALALVRRLRPRLVVWDPALPTLADGPLAELLRHDPAIERVPGSVHLVEGASS